MRVYQIGPDGLYAGPVNADPNPRRPGQYLIPADCVTVEPPQVSGKQARYGEAGWVLEDIPQPLPEPDEQVEAQINKVHKQADAMLAVADQQIAEAASAGASIPAAWVEYRKALAAIKQQDVDTPVVWPETPPPIELPQTPDTLEAYAAAKRYSVEVGGINFHGVLIDTSDKSQAKLAAAYQLTQLTGTNVDFKGITGFVNLTPEYVEAVSIAAGTHVQACFSAEKQILEMIAAGEITTREEIDNFPWPGIIETGI